MTQNATVWMEIANEAIRHRSHLPALMRLIGREWRERVDRIGTENGELR
jgi:hypothetical protein